MVSIVVMVLFLLLAPGSYGMRLLTLLDSNLDPVRSVQRKTRAFEEIDNCGAPISSLWCRNG